MRTVLFVTLVACLLIVPSVAADPTTGLREAAQEVGEDVGDCLLIMARPWESPVEPVLYTVGAALCIAGSL